MPQFKDNIDPPKKNYPLTGFLVSYIFTKSPAIPGGPEAPADPFTP